MKRRRAMKGAMSDITPSNIKDADESSEEENIFEGDGDDARHQSVGAGETAHHGKRSTLWGKVTTNLTPLMRWIAQGKQKRKKEESTQIHHQKSGVHRHSLEDLSKAANLEELKEKTKVKKDEDEDSQVDDTEEDNQRRISHKAVKCLEIALPVIRGMKDETVEPVQKFFEDHSFDAWEFNVFDLDEITKGHSLWFLGMILFEHYKIVDIFQINGLKVRAEGLIAEGPAR